MISNITINGIAYKLIFNPNKLIIPCDKCNLISFCQTNEEFIRVCDHNNDNNYYN